MLLADALDLRVDNTWTSYKLVALFYITGRVKELTEYNKWSSAKAKSTTAVHSKIRFNRNYREWTISSDGRTGNQLGSSRQSKTLSTSWRRTLCRALRHLSEARKRPKHYASSYWVWSCWCSDREPCRLCPKQRHLSTRRQSTVQCGAI